MSNALGPDENEPIPYIPAWSKNTPPHGYSPVHAEPDTPHVPAVRESPPRTRTVRRAHGAAPRRAPGRGALIAFVVAVLFVAVAGGAWWYVNRDASPRIKEGDCLRSADDFDQEPVDCASAGARFVVIERIEGTTFPGMCDSVPDATVALTSDPNDPFVLCLAVHG